MNKNLHIEEYLKNYIEQSKPEFAVLLNGKWGHYTSNLNWHPKTRNPTKECSLISTITSS